MTEEGNPTPFADHYLTLEAVRFFNLFDQNKEHALIALDLIIAVVPEEKKDLYRSVWARVKFLQ